MIIQPIPKHCIIRFITFPYQIATHYGFARCAEIRHCLFCEDGHVDMSMSFIVGAINRRDKQVAVYEFGRDVFRGIALLATNIKWGDPSQYDIEIKSLQNGSYALPRPHSPLTASDITMKNTFDMKWWNEQCKPASIEQNKIDHDRYINKLAMLK